jgi:hypothetical protein
LRPSDGNPDNVPIGFALFGGRGRLGFAAEIFLERFEIDLHAV